MADQSTFTPEEWTALTEAPLRITLALVAVGPHGPISVVKEVTASAREMAHPRSQGPADSLIAELAKEAAGREARHNVEAQRGQRPDEVVEAGMAALQTAASALGKATADEAAAVRAWLLAIAQAVAGAANAVSPEEQAVLDRIAATLGS